MQEIIITLTVLILGILALVPIFKIIAQIYPYSYVNARLRVMRSELISKDDFEELLKRPYNSIIYTLEKNSFEDFSKYLKGDFSYGSVDSALRTDLVNTLNKVKNMSPKKEFLKRLLSKYDILLIETIARSTKNLNAQNEDLIHFTDIFSKEFLYKKNQRLEDLQNEIKGTPYQKIFEKHLSNIRNKKFEEFEEDLDKLFFKRLLAVSSQEQKRYVKLLIDNHNISLALKNKNTRIPSGTLKNIPNDFEKIKNQISKKYKTTATTQEELERDMQKKLKELGENLMKKNPLSQSTIVGFIILKTVNIRNINILLKLKHEGFEKEEIKKVLAI